MKRGYDVRFDHLDTDGSEIEFYVSIREISSIKSKKKGKEMKNVNIEQLRIPAYAVVNTNKNFAVSIALNRDDARSDLQAMKRDTGSKDFKIVKLTAEKWIR